jgi:hypothetical protein
MVGEAVMPATILPFERRPSTVLPLAPEGDPVAGLTRSPPPVAAFRPRAAPTSQQIAHRWAMLSHLSRRVPRPPDTVR